jgi:GT2 family glycosyltransferase
VPHSSHDAVVAAVINYNTAALTLRCVGSLLDAGITRVLVLDNASAGTDFERIASGLAPERERVQLLRSDENLGFARGCNRLIDQALDDPRCTHVLLANSDSVAVADGLRRCLQAMHEGSHDLMGGRMIKPPSPDGSVTVDSLGIALYKSLLASNRMSPEEAYLGPTGGFAVLSRRFLEEVRRLHGHVFEPSFFCYAEDTDLCVRARLLGASVGYVDQVVAHHAGQASNAGVYDDFILYHGIRNSIWMAARSLPAGTILRSVHWVLLLHCGIALRHLLQGRWRTVARLYRDAIAGLPAALRARRVIQGTRRVTAREFARHVDSHFYEPTFLRNAVADLFRRGGGRDTGPAPASFKPGSGRVRALAEVGTAGNGREVAARAGPHPPAPNPKAVDWMVASDIELAPDFIAFLQHCEAGLAPKGLLALAGIDKRFGPGRSRPVSGIAEVVEAHVEAREVPARGAVVEHYMSLGQVREAREGKAAADVRSWCFTPGSLRVLLLDLFELGYTKLREVRVLPTEGGEFVIVLGEHGAGPGLPRLELMRAVEGELAQGGRARHG